MKYLSTRNAALSFSAAECFVKGISAEGGLFVPQEFPKISLEKIASMADKSYSERAFDVLSCYLTDFSEAELKACISGAYGTKFDNEKIVPLHYLNDCAVLELFHGPTLAFKDMALQMLPHFLTCARGKVGEKYKTLILVATSGDTGKAALEGFCDVDGVSIAVFFPNQGVSKMQQAQMTTQEGKNVFVCAVNGNFDDAQTGVKQIFTDPDAQEKLREKGYELSSANSINWGRLVPQIVYYFSAYADMLKDKKISLGEKINFVVPTGNFGDILAGWYAKQMGLPIEKLVCASNKNNVLTDFFKTGEYNANREFFKTMSPSMDILISSNLERLLFELSGKDDKLVSQMMLSLKENGVYKVSDKILAGLNESFEAGWADEADTAATIKQVWNEDSYCIDTHTAVALSVCRKMQKTHKTVVLSTASPYKFPAWVLKAIYGSAPEDEFEGADQLEKMGVKMPKQIAELKNKPVLHKTVCNKQDMKEIILNNIK